MNIYDQRIAKARNRMEDAGISLLVLSLIHISFGLHAVWLSLPLAEITSVVLSSILFRKIYLDKIKPLGQAAA